jgi:lysophospholipase L1-like esterase
LERINDIGTGDVSAKQIIAGLKQIGIRYHAHGIKIYAGTLAPTEGTNIGPQFEYGSPEGEAKREIVNEFIRTGDFFDGVIDFDTAIQDPDQSDRILPKYDSGGRLHLSDAGYREMAKTVDLSVFENTETEPSTKPKRGRVSGQPNFLAKE